MLTAADLTGCPIDDMAPLRACKDEHNREEVRQHRRVLLQVWSHLEESEEASLL